MLRRLVQRIRSDESSTKIRYKAVIGLGNPGPEYSQSRHNAGFMIVDQLCARYQLTDRGNRFGSILSQYNQNDGAVIFAKPLTYMNRSGIAVDQILRYYAIQLEDLLVVYDELDLAFGRMQIRPGGSAGGHNGMRSVLEALGTNDVPRLRFGIGRPVRGATIDYVLDSFDDEQENRLPGLLTQAADAVEHWLQQGIQSAMNETNRRTAEEAV